MDDEDHFCFDGDNIPDNARYYANLKEKVSREA